MPPAPIISFLTFFFFLSLNLFFSFSLTAYSPTSLYNIFFSLFSLPYFIIFAFQPSIFHSFSSFFFSLFFPSKLFFLSPLFLHLLLSSFSAKCFPTPEQSIQSFNHPPLPCTLSLVSLTYCLFLSAFYPHWLFNYTFLIHLSPLPIFPSVCLSPVIPFFFHAS